ncbi:MAG: T9SS type A sorting domain-containing protein [Bacteroidetes bacterium]|nr:T9SS type A sorting domain-containing protein [Bacteroidota bacterium]
MLKQIITYLLILLNVNFFAQNVLSCGKGLNGQVYGLYNDTVIKKLIVSGWFTMADGKPYNGLATWDGVKFDSLGKNNPYPNGFRKEPFIQYKNKLYVFGIDKYLYSFNYQTKIWTQIPGKYDNLIRDFTIYNNDLIIVGDFKKVGNTVVKNIIKFNGTNYDTLPKPIFSGFIFTAEVYKNELYIGGNFDQFSPYTGIAKFNGTSWVKVSNNTALTGASQEVWDLVIYNNKLFITGNWAFTNGIFQPSLATWDGQNWGNIGTMIFNGGIPAANSTFKIYNNKLYVIGGFDSINNIKTANIAVWNDTIWCGVKMINNTGLQIAPIENYNNQWYIAGNQTMIADTVEITASMIPDTINGLGRYIGNNGKLERNCFDKPIIKPDFSIYPNPFSDKITINTSTTDPTTLKKITLINMLGQKVFYLEFYQNNISIDLPQLLDGTYIAELYLNNQLSFRTKLLKL